MTSERPQRPDLTPDEQASAAESAAEEEAALAAEAESEAEAALAAEAAPAAAAGLPATETSSAAVERPSSAARPSTETPGTARTPTPAPRTATSSTPAARSTTPTPTPGPTPTLAPVPSRRAELRLARLHLRTGMLPLARAELEQLAGSGGLDMDALADLAEARWRSGDLEGAAEAANAHLANGGQEPISELILAEALDRNGHLIDARAHSSRAMERMGTGLDRMFAGEPRSTAWPAVDGDPMYRDANELGRRGLLVSGADMQIKAERNWEPAPSPGQPGGRSGGKSGRSAGSLDAAAGAVPGPQATSIGELMDAGRAAGLELESVEQEIAAGHLDGIADRLALLFRMDRALAPVILSLADRVLGAMDASDPRAASLHTLRGDIYRGLGREAEATAAYQQALRAVAPRTPDRSTS